MHAYTHDNVNFFRITHCFPIVVISVEESFIGSDLLEIWSF